MNRSFTNSAMGAFGVLAVLALLAAPARVEARLGGPFGVGVIAGDPSGLSGKLWLNNTNALDFIAGFSVQHDWIKLNADYVWHDFDIIPVTSGQLPIYYGIGAWTSVSSNARIGLRGVVGIEYLFPKAPLDVFLEVGPGTAIIPETRFDFSGGLGMRFYF